MTSLDRQRHPSYQSLERVGLRTRDTGVVGLHTENLFDENERVTDGALYNEEDGKAYDNSGSTDEAYFSTTSTGHIIDPFSVEGNDVMGPVETEQDMAAAWLATHEATVVAVDEQHQNVA